MKVRTVAQLDRHLDRALSWRKKELTSARFIVAAAPSGNERVLVRAATTLLYAHWEGFVKSAGSAYAEFVARQGLSLDALQPNFLALQMRSAIDACAAAKRLQPHVALVRALTSGLARPSKLPWQRAVRTRANLKAAVFQEIIETLGLDFAPFAMKGKPVIDRLVDTRNGIAHGGGHGITAAEYASLHQEVVVLLEDFREQVQTAAAAGKYRL